MHCEKHGQQPVICRFCDIESIRRNEILLLDRTLAGLEGWTNVGPLLAVPPGSSCGSGRGQLQKFPRYTDDSHQVIRLCCTYDIRFYGGAMYAEASYGHTALGNQYVCEMVEKHGSMEKAVHVAVVRAAIKVLESRSSSAVIRPSPDVGVVGMEQQCQ